MRHPSVRVDCAAALQLEDEVARKAALDALFAQVSKVRDMEVVFQSYGFQGFLSVPTFSVRGIEFTPPASECFSMSSSPNAPVAGALTRFFAWELLDEITLLSLKAGATFSGAFNPRPTLIWRGEPLAPLTPIPHPASIIDPLAHTTS